VVCVAYVDDAVPSAQQVRTRSNYYWREPAGDESGGTTLVWSNDVGPLLRKLGFVKFGRWTSNEHYKAIVDRAYRERRDLR
jgi:hypothetical protein